MKRITLVALLISALSISAIASTKHPVAFAKVPKGVQKVLLKNFTEDQVQLVTSEKKVGRVDYMFILADETKIVYDDKGVLRNAVNQQGIKNELLPNLMLEYVKKTLPHARITEYKFEGSKKEINLNDQMKLIFNKKDRFIRLDD
jgi:hypothetical protein